MASWNAPTTHSTGDLLSVTDWNTVANNETFLYQAPYASYYNSVATSVPANTVTQVALGGTEFSGYGFSISGNNAIIPIAGIFCGLANVGIGSLGSGSFIVTEILQNGNAKAVATNAIGASGAVSFPASKILKCAVSDTIGLYVDQSGGTLGTTASLSVTYLNLFFVGSQ